MDRKLKIFKEYYLKYVILILLCTAAGIYILYTTVYSYKDTTVSILFINDASLDTEALENELYDVLDLEGTCYETEVSQMSEENALTRTTLSARIAAGDLDIVIADEDVFQYYAKKGVAADLSEMLTEEELESLSDRMLRLQARETDVKGNVTAEYEEKPYGIDVTGWASLEEYTQSLEKPVLFFIAGADDTGEELRVLRHWEA